MHTFQRAQKETERDGEERVYGDTGQGIWFSENMECNKATPNTNEFLEVEGKYYNMDEDKAKQLSITYKGFFRIPTRYQDRKRRRSNRNRMKVEAEAHDSESEKSMQKLMRADLGSS